MLTQPSDVQEKIHLTATLAALHKHVRGKNKTCSSFLRDWMLLHSATYFFVSMPPWFSRPLLGWRDAHPGYVKLLRERGIKLPDERSAEWREIGMTMPRQPDPPGLSGR
jgi:hypothetical protein